MILFQMYQYYRKKGAMEHKCIDKYLNDYSLCLLLFTFFSVISSKRYLQLLMSEEERTSLTMMVLTQNILKANR